MKFVLVNGRTPRPQSFCALCCESIGGSYLREIATRPPTAITSATSVVRNLPPRYSPKSCEGVIMSQKLNLPSPRAEHQDSRHKRRGVRGIEIGCAVLTSQYVHPEFGFFCPTPRFRRRLRVALACLVVAGWAQL